MPYCIGDKELGLTLKPDIGSEMCIRIQCSSDAEFAQCIVVHSWHKDESGCIGLGEDLREEPRRNCTGKPYVRRFVAKCMPLGCSTCRGDSHQESYLPSQVLDWAGRDGYQRCPGQVFHAPG